MQVGGSFGLSGLGQVSFERLDAQSLPVHEIPEVGAMKFDLGEVV